MFVPRNWITGEALNTSLPELLVEADPRGMSLCEVDLRMQKLVRANLSRAILIGANLENADLTGGILTDAELIGQQKLLEALGREHHADH